MRVGCSPTQKTVVMIRCRHGYRPKPWPRVVGMSTCGWSRLSCSRRMACACVSNSGEAARLEATASEAGKQRIKQAVNQATGWGRRELMRAKVEEEKTPGNWFCARRRPPDQAEGEAGVCPRKSRTFAAA